MKITILGSGGFTKTPITNCHCVVCEKARDDKLMARTGPSLYIHDLDLIIDLSIDSFAQVDKLGFFPKKIAFSHWHPDHTEGWRVLEQFDNKPSVYIQDNSKITEFISGLSFLNSSGKIELKNWNIKEKIKKNATSMQYLIIGGHVPVYGFLLKEGRKSILIVPDHSKSLLSNLYITKPDFIIMNLGSKIRNSDNTTLEDNEKIIQKYSPKKIIFTHIEPHLDFNINEINKIISSRNYLLAKDNESIQI